EYLKIIASTQSLILRISLLKTQEKGQTQERVDGRHREQIWKKDPQGDLEYPDPGKLKSDFDGCSSRNLRLEATEGLVVMIQ
ncbi:hypothetical protein PJP07_31035, partial [Mycobacterium kansasii]